MAKKILAQIALAIFINILILPVAVWAEPADSADPKIKQEATELNSLANPFKNLKPCINEFKTNEDGTLTNKENPESGDDNGYVITIIEEPLNVETSGSTKSKDGKPPDNYVVRACFRNTFQYYNKDDKDDKKFHSVPMLAASCSQNAQDLLEKAELKEYQVKYSCKEVMVILTKGGTTAIYGYINLLYRWGAGMVGIIAVTVIIVSGIQISASGGDSEAIGSAKKRILQSIVGIVVLFLSSLILYTINPNFFTR